MMCQHMLAICKATKTDESYDATTQNAKRKTLGNLICVLGGGFDRTGLNTL